MGEPFSKNGRWALRKKLIAVLEAGNFERGGPLADDMSLIKSGQLDSLGLFNLALFIESEIGRRVDITSFDLATAWDTVGKILDFIQELGAYQ